MSSIFKINFFPRRSPLDPFESSSEDELMVELRKSGAKVQIGQLGPRQETKSTRKYSPIKFSQSPGSDSDSSAELFRPPTKKCKILWLGGKYCVSDCLKLIELILKTLNPSYPE